MTDYNIFAKITTEKTYYLPKQGQLNISKTIQLLKRYE